MKEFQKSDQYQSLPETKGDAASSTPVPVIPIADNLSSCCSNYLCVPVFQAARTQPHWQAQRLKESTPCAIGMHTVSSHVAIVSGARPSPSVPSTIASLSSFISFGSSILRNPLSMPSPPYEIPVHEAASANSRNLLSLPAPSFVLSLFPALSLLPDPDFVLSLFPGSFFFFHLWIPFYPHSQLSLLPNRISHSLRLCLLSKICPRHLKHRPHTHTDCSPVKRIAAPCGQQHRIHSKRRSRAENSARSSDLPHFPKLQFVLPPCRHSAPKGAAAGTSHRAFLWSVETPSGFREYIKLRRVDRDLPAPRKNLLSFSLNMPFFRQN